MHALNDLAELLVASHAALFVVAARSKQGFHAHLVRMVAVVAKSNHIVIDHQRVIGVRASKVVDVIEDWRQRAALPLDALQRDTVSVVLQVSTLDVPLCDLRPV